MKRPSHKQSNKLLLESHLKTLRLPTMLAECPAVVRECVAHDAPYEAFLERLAELEVNARDAKATERRLKQAGFPVSKELADFDFSAVPKLNKTRLLALSRGEFISQRANLVLLGAPGTGKTHLAIGLGRELCRAGYRVKFFTAAGLTNLYREAWEERHVLRFEASLRRLDVIVIDELGYVPLDKEAAEHLFGFFSQCYEQTSLIVTSNLPFADWPATFAGDERMTGALLDRLTHRVHIVDIEGESYRLKASLKARQGRPAAPREKVSHKQPTSATGKQRASATGAEPSSAKDEPASGSNEPGPTNKEPTGSATKKVD